MSSYSFPLLQDKEVVACLHELGMNASMELLAKPTYEFVQPVYEFLVTNFMGVTRDELQQPVFAALDALEFPELHDESIPALSFLKSLNSLLVASGVKDFSLRDLYKPDPLRLRRNLSAIINFVKFREEKLVAYTELQEQFADLIQNKQKMDAEHAQLKAEIAELQAAREAELPEVSRVEAETQAIYAENQALNKTQAALNNEVRTLKQQANNLTDEASQLRYKLSQAHSQTEHLRSQIVHSPQKLQSLLEEISNAVESERAALTEAEKRSRDLAARLDIVSKVDKEVGKAVALMGEAESEISKKKEISQKVKALRSDVASNEHEAAQLTATHQHLKRQQASLNERIARLQEQLKIRKDAVESQIDEQLRNKEAIEAENAAALAKITENEALSRALTERMAEMKSVHDAQIEYVLQQYSSLREAVQKYHQDMEEAMTVAAPPTVVA